MADDEPIVEDSDDDTPSEDTPTELEILQEISNDFKYFIKCIIPNSIYSDWDYPEPEPDPEPEPEPEPDPEPDPDPDPDPDPSDV